MESARIVVRGSSSGEGSRKRECMAVAGEGSRKRGCRAVAGNRV